MNSRRRVNSTVRFLLLILWVTSGPPSSCCTSQWYLHCSFSLIEFCASNILTIGRLGTLTANRMGSFGYPGNLLSREVCSCGSAALWPSVILGVRGCFPRLTGSHGTRAHDVSCIGGVRSHLDGWPSSRRSFCFSFFAEDETQQIVGRERRERENITGRYRSRY